MIKNYRDLVVWQKSITLVTDIYVLTRQFPNSEVYGLASQMQRAAVSVPSNIAEGYERKYSGDFSRFLSIASGSVAELETQLVIAINLGYLSQEMASGVQSLADEVSKMLYSLSNKVKEHPAQPTK